MRTLIPIIFALLLVGAASIAEAQQVNAITNGTFQSGSSGWTTFGSFYADGRFSNCHSCPGYAYLSNFDGTGGNNLVGWITQQVSIPAGATGATLTFWYSITTTDTSGVPHDVVSVILIDSATNASTLVHAFDNRNAGSGYSSYSYDLSNFVGKTFTVQFLGSTDGSSPTVFRIDDVSATYTPAPPPPPPQPPSPPTNLVATGSDSSINLTWNDNANNELAYEVQRASLGGAFGQLTTLGANRTTYTDSIGSYGVIDCYQVRATNAAGVSGYTNQACGTTLAPPTLSFPDDGATLTNASVAMSWQSALGATNYIVNVGRSCGGTEIVNGQSTIQVSLSIPVSQGTYVWQVQTRNTNNPGASAFSQCRTFTISTNPAPVANFTWSPQPSKAGQSVSFTDQSSNATSWLWTFGDGSTSVLQNPAHTFGAAGNYTVALTATNSIGSNSTTRTVTVIAPPVASFTSSPASPTTGQAVAFTDTSTGAPTSWQWSFGDTATSSSQNPSHAYGNAGTYTVTLTASNAAGGNSTSSQIHVGTTPTVPVASFTYSPANPQTGQTVSFTDSSSGSPTAWQWSFGDGASSTSQNPSHIYASANTYHVTMSAANVAGSNSTVQDLKVVTAPHVPTASFTYSPQFPAASQAVAFTDTSGFAPTSWAWNFGDGDTSTAESPAHTFTSAGTFTVSLTATNSAGTNATNQQITVHSTGSAPTASFTYSPNPPQAGQVVTFSDTSSGSPTSWTWTFSDGGTASTATTTHTFVAAGSYSVTLLAANGFGSNSTTQQINVMVVSATLSADFSWSPTNPMPTTSVVFKDVSAGSPTSWEWNFDDNTTSTQQNPIHSFLNVGLYFVTLTAKNSGGTSVAVHAVSVGTAPVPDFSYRPENPRVDDNVQFTATADIPVLSWSWDFGDGAFSSSQNPLHSFKAAGDKTVSLTVSNNVGVRTVSKIIHATASGTCSNCVTTLSGHIFLGSVPVRGAHVAIAISDTTIQGRWSIDHIDADGSYSIPVNTHLGDSITVTASITYPDSFGTLVSSRIATLTRTMPVPSTGAVPDLDFPPPIILVHGIRSDPTRWKIWADLFGTQTVVFGPSYDDRAAYGDEARDVEEQLLVFFNPLATTMPRLRFIGHSKGGLVTRALLGFTTIGDAAVDVIELATPNLGTACYQGADTQLIAAVYGLLPDQVGFSIPDNRYETLLQSGHLHAIAGTEDAPGALLLAALAPPCPDSCEPSDGLVNVTSATTLQTLNGSRSPIPSFVGPYLHEDLGTNASAWLASSVVLPYYNGAQWPSCGANLLPGGCVSAGCVAGRGLHRAAGVSDCSIVHPGTSYVEITWAEPTTAGELPQIAFAKRWYGAFSCPITKAAPRTTSIYGYLIYRAGTPAVPRVGENRIAFVPFGTDHFDDIDAPLGSYYAVTVIYGDNQEDGLSRTVTADTSSRRRPS